MHRWKVIKAKYPVDPNLPWVAYPGTSLIRGRRFATWADAWAYATRRAIR
jgi:hypothetical protein